jgi:hypothetical protein
VFFEHLHPVAGFGLDSDWEDPVDSPGDHRAPHRLSLLAMAWQAHSFASFPLCDLQLERVSQLS